MNTSLKLHGLVAAVHTPFKADGSLNASSVDAQAKLLASQGIKLAFITGSTGESSSMQLAERKEIYSAWKEASAKHGVQVIAHTGSNSVWDARELAAFAQECGFVATSSLAPSNPPRFSAWWNAAPLPLPALRTCLITIMIFPC